MLDAYSLMYNILKNISIKIKNCQCNILVWGELFMSDSKEKINMISITLSTEGLKQSPMLQQMQENVSHQILHVRTANDTQKIQSSDWSE